MKARKPNYDERNKTADPNAPHAYPRRVLLAVTGLSPQVVTETLYALVHQKPAFVPTEIHLLTTAEGASSARLTLLSDDPGWFYRIQKDYRLPPIRFDSSTIHALDAPDIRTSLENEQLADALTRTIRELTTDNTCALHVSIAGGRKTMGFYAGYVLSLFGRAQDRLSHVLVSERYEGHTEFFYPSPGPRTIYGKDKKPLDASQAEIRLAEIPFVRFGREFDNRLREGRITFSEAVAAAQRALDPPSLEIDMDEKCIHAGDQRVRLSKTLLTFLSWFARRAESGGADIECPKEGVPDLDYQREYFEEYVHLGDIPLSLRDQRFRDKDGKPGMNKAFFMETKSRLHDAMENALGPAGVRRYGIRSNGRNKGFRIAVSPEFIRRAGELDGGESCKLAKSQTSGKTER